MSPIIFIILLILVLGAFGSGVGGYIGPGWGYGGGGGLLLLLIILLIFFR